MHKTKIFELKHGVENKIIIDVDKIDGVDFQGNFHLYLFKFSKLKVLIYDYLKRLDDGTKIELSTIHSLFRRFVDSDYFDSVEHQTLMSNDVKYAETYEKYVGRIGRYLWNDGPIRYNSYIFDAKYLLIGEYQHYAAKGLQFIYAAFTHPAGNASYSRSISNKDATNAMKNLFEDKKALERKYFGEILEVFNEQSPDFLKAYGYANYIEIYDTTSELLFKVTLCKDNFHQYEIVFPTKSKNKTRKLASTLAFNFIIKHQTVAALLNSLMLEKNRLLTNNYLNELNDIKNTDAFEIYVNSISAVLNDMIDRNVSTFVSYPRLVGMFVRDNIVETSIINMSSGRNYLRISRNIHYTDIDVKDVQLKSFYLKGNTTQIAEQLFYLDFINVYDRKVHHDLNEYYLIANQKLTASKMLLREPVKTILLELFEPYENLQQSLLTEIETAVRNNETFEDTRKVFSTSEIRTLPEIRFMNKRIDAYIDIPKYSSNADLFDANKRIANRIKMKASSTSVQS